MSGSVHSKHPFAREGIHYDPPPPSEFDKASVGRIATVVTKAVDYELGESLEDVIRALGGRLHYLDVIAWEETDDGSILVHGPQDFDICLAQFNSDLRDRFTVAHELGHYFLHSKQGDIQIEAARFGTGRAEWEANWFAAALLMPEDDVRQQYDRTGEVGLAARYQVSTEALKVRLDSLELVGSNGF